VTDTQLQKEIFEEKDVDESKNLPKKILD